MTHSLPALGYDYDALEPFIDAQTLRLHHDVHHAEYVARLNELLAQAPRLSGKTLEQLLSDIRAVPEPLRQDVRNAGGAHLNHSLLWHTMAPGKGGQPHGELADAINEACGSFEKFRQMFTDEALNRHGSGWAFLAMDSGGHLAVLTTPNQDSPIMLGYRPILALDLWEHAYYLRYLDRKQDYIEAWWNLVNWDNVSELYHHCLEMTRRQLSHKA